MALKESYKELLLLVVLLAIAATIFGHIIYFAEILTDEFLTIPYALWWAVITMTTVGYGDFKPVSTQGYIVGCACAVCGILVIAIPVPVIVNNFGTYFKIAKMCERLQTRHIISVPTEKQLDCNSTEPESGHIHVHDLD